MSFLPDTDRYAFYTRQQVAVHDCDAHSRLRLAAALRYVETISTAHLDALELGHQRLYSEGIVFVLAAQAVKVHKLPTVHDELLLKTCPAASKGAQLVRETVILNALGEQLIEVQASWVIIDPVHRRPMRPGAFVDKLPVLKTWHPFVNPTSLKLPGAATFVMQYPVLYSHLDINLHMNNTVYADLVMNSLPLQDALGRTPDTFLIRLRMETKGGDMLHIYRDELDNGWLVSALTERGSCFEAKITFK